MNPVLVSPLIFWISTLLLWVLAYWFYRDYRVDLFRQRLFGIRARLFDVALGGAIAFDDPAYTRLRTLLNGFIRYGNRLNIPVTGMLFWAMRGSELSEHRSAFEQDWEQAIAVLDEPTRRTLIGLRTEMHFEVGKQIFLASPLSLLTVVPVVLLVLIQLATTQLVGALVRRSYRACAGYCRRMLLTPLDSIAFQFATDASLARITGEHRAMVARR